MVRKAIVTSKDTYLVLFHIATQGREEPVSISQLNKRLAFAKREKKRLQDA
jgi:hypothetical protein